LLGSLVFLVMADGLLTNILVNFGIASEGNPFLAEIAGDAGMIVIKSVGLVICVLVLRDIYKHAPRLALISSGLAVVAYAVIVSWNLTLLLRANG